MLSPLSNWFICTLVGKKNEQKLTLTFTSGGNFHLNAMFLDRGRELEHEVGFFHTSVEKVYLYETYL